MKRTQGLVLLVAALAALASPHAGATEEAGPRDLTECVSSALECPGGGAVEDAPPAPQKPPVQASVLGGMGTFLMAVGGAAVGGLGAAFVGSGQLVLAALAGLAGWLAGMRPDFVSVPIYAGVAAGGIAVAAGGTQAAGYSVWRRWESLVSLFLPLFSRIEKDHVLDNQHRAQIFELIKQQPGIHLSAVARTLELAWGTTLHHLRKLREQRLIIIQAVANHKCYFLNGSGYSRQQMEAMSLLKNDTLADVASAIESHPKASLKQVSKSIGISSPLAAHHVRTLERAGLIQKTRAGRSIELTPTGIVPRGFFNELRPHACAAEGAVGFA